MSKVYSKFDFVGKNKRLESFLIFCLYACFIFLLTTCSSDSLSFPEGFVQFYPKLEAWENRSEGFTLVSISSADGAQGFFEWDAEGIYGRIVEAGASKDVRFFSIGDGGMNGLALEAKKKGKSLEIFYNSMLQNSYVSQGESNQHKISVDRLKAIEDLRLLGGMFEETQENGRKISMRLQYLVSRKDFEERAFDDFLRRGNSPYKMAEFRRARLEASSLVKYDLPEDSGNSDSESMKNVSKEDRSSRVQYLLPPIEYYEIQYPIYISENIICVATQYYLFNGGAHGSASTDLDIIDRKTGKRLEVGDVLVGDWKIALGPKLKAELLRQSRYWKASGSAAKVQNDKNISIEDLRELGLFESDIYPSDKIFLCKTGIGFEYDQYELAPRYFGEFIILLPWDELKPFLNPAFFTDGQILGSI